LKIKTIKFLKLKIEKRLIEVNSSRIIPGCLLHNSKACSKTDLTNKPLQVDVENASRSQLIYLINQMVPFFVSANANINQKKRQMTANYQKVQNELDSKGTTHKLKAPRLINIDFQDLIM